MKKDYSFVREIAKLISQSNPKDVFVVGSVGRGSKNPKDIDLITTTNLPELMKWFDQEFKIKKIDKSGPKFIKFTINGMKGKKTDYNFTNWVLPINIWKTSLEDLASAVVSYSYPRNFIIGLRKKAKNLGYKFTNHGIYKGKKKLPPMDIKSIFKFFDIKYRLPEVEEMKGKGLASRAFQVSANIYRKLRCGNKSRQLYDGEYHPLCSNYCGPGTRVDLPEVRNFPPYNEVDNVCRNHDLDYNEADKLQGEERYKKFREADEKMLRDLEQFKNIEPYYSIAKKAISLKVKGEDWIPFLSKLINPYHGKK